MIAEVASSLTWEEKPPPPLLFCFAHAALSLPCLPLRPPQWVAGLQAVPGLAQEHLCLFSSRYISFHFISFHFISCMKNSPSHILLVKGCTEAQQRERN